MPQTMTLADGRHLSYVDSGDATAPTIFFFHGSGSSADGLDLAARVARHGGRFISPARPGIGASDPKPGRGLSGWAHDVAELADHLSVAKFAVLGFSGGAPYALATAAVLPERVTGAAVMSTGGPFDVPGGLDGMSRSNRIVWFLVKRAPGVMRFLNRQQAKQIAKDSNSPTKSATRMLKGADQVAVAALSPAAASCFFDAPMAEALAQGPNGLVQDMQILRASWDFAPSQVKAPVWLWHGTSDSSAPQAMAEFLTQTIPSCEAIFMEGGGHLSTIFESIDQAIDKLLASQL